MARKLTQNTCQYDKNIVTLQNKSQKSIDHKRL